MGSRQAHGVVDENDRCVHGVGVPLLVDIVLVALPHCHTDVAPVRSKTAVLVPVGVGTVYKPVGAVVRPRFALWVW